MHIYWETNICSKSELIDTDLQNQNFYQLLLAYYYNKLITVPTRVDERTQTRSLIDNIYANIQKSDSDMSGVLKTHISDHYSIFHVHRNTDRTTHKQYRTKRNFSEKHKALFKKSLKRDGWADIYSWHIPSLV